MYLTLEDSCSSAPIRVPEDPPCRPYMGGGAGRAQQLSKGSMLAQTWDWYSGGERLVTCTQGGPKETLSNHLYPRILRRDLFIKTGLAGACSLTSLYWSVKHLWASGDTVATLLYAPGLETLGDCFWSHLSLPQTTLLSGNSHFSRKLQFNNHSKV